MDHENSYTPIKESRSKRPYLSLLAADMCDPYAVNWQCTGEVLASQTMLLCVSHSGSPHSVLYTGKHLIRSVTDYWGEAERAPH